MATPSRTFRIPDAVFNEVRRLAQDKGTSVNAVIVRELEDYITDTEWRERALRAEAELRELRQRAEERL